MQLDGGNSSGSGTPQPTDQRPVFDLLFELCEGHGSRLEIYNELIVGADLTFPNAGAILSADASTFASTRVVMAGIRLDWVNPEDRQGYSCSLTCRITELRGQSADRSDQITLRVPEQHNPVTVKPPTMATAFTMMVNWNGWYPEGYDQEYVDRSVRSAKDTEPELLRALPVGKVDSGQLPGKFTTIDLAVMYKLLRTAFPPTDA